VKRRGQGAVAIVACCVCAGAATVAFAVGRAPRSPDTAPVAAPRQVSEQELWQCRLNMNPSDREALRALAQMALQAGAYGDAVRYVGALAELDPAEPDGWAALAALSDRAGDRQQAIGAAQRALALMPGRDDMTAIFVRNVTALNEARIGSRSIGGRP